MVVDKAASVPEVAVSTRSAAVERFPENTCDERKKPSQCTAEDDRHLENAKEGNHSQSEQEDSMKGASRENAHCVTPEQKKSATPKVSQSSLNRKSTNPTATKPHDTTKNSGLSELSKQLRVLQAKNQAQTNQIDRLERQLKILAELKGVSISDLRKALQAACEGEAHADLWNQVGALRAKLDAAAVANSASSRDASSFDKESTCRAIATLELRVGELEEVEDTLRAETRGLYQSLNEQTSRAASLESRCAQQQEQLDDLRKSNDVASRYAQQSKAVVAEESIVVKAEIANLEDRARTAELQLQIEKDRAQVLENQVEAREKESQLRNEQFKSRFQVQDERIHDLEQQLSSLYTAFELLRQERSDEDQRRASLQTNLYDADEKVARQLQGETENEHQTSAIPVVPATPLPVPSSDASSPNSRSYESVPTTPSSAVSVGTRVVLFDLTKEPQYNGKTGVVLSSLNQEGRQLVYLEEMDNTMELPPKNLKPEPVRCASQEVSSGFLFKRDSKFLKAWKKRYFVLYGGLGDYHLSYSDAPGQKVKGTLDIKAGVSTVTQTRQFPNQPFAFVLHINRHDARAPELYAAAASQQDFQLWLSALTVATTDVGATAQAARESVEQQEVADLEMALRMQMEEQRSSFSGPFS